ncbi:MAG: O-methyltransferase [Cyanobacteriota bacterium]
MNNLVKQKLEELEKTRNQFWNVSREVGKLLYILASTSNSKNILELGTSNGYSTIWLALAAQKTGGHIITFEYFENRVLLASENFLHCKLDQYVTIKQGKIIDILRNYNHECDFAFIDANKQEYLEYFNLLDKSLKPGGIIVSDNISSHKEDLQNFTDFIYKHKDYISVFLPVDNGLLISYKIYN